ncbi:hypothetical protein J1N35_023163 [Gossypium stocksii]|uniref:Uncharacterized protein n=1 Tax=Gossypium stocksii TaxID=47602 RepID=A0A9D3VJ90_9ROSI|nr:hypothetical protein J1N35_023163 [Gossypium stocksii]
MKNLKDQWAIDSFIMRGQSSRGDPKGKQKVKGFIHVILGTDEEWVGSSTKRKVHMSSVISVNAPKRSCFKVKRILVDSRSTVEGSITLPVTLGDGENMTTKYVQFFVMNQPMAYNDIFG